MSDPIIKGGQGRSAQSVRDDASSIMVAFTITLGLLIGWGLYVWLS